MRGSTQVLFNGCVITTILFALCAVPQAWAQAARMTPSSVTLSAWDGVEITLLQVDLLKRHLIFKIRGQETTSVTATAPLRLSFDAPIVRVELLEVPQTIRMDSLILDQTATFTLSRDPFMPPQAWAYRVMVEFATLPTSGHMRIGTGDIQPVTYALTPTAPHDDPSRPAS